MSNQEASSQEDEVTYSLPLPIPNVDWSRLNRDFDEKARRYLDGTACRTSV
jgi:hypothetical protein